MHALPLTLFGVAEPEVRSISVDITRHQLDPCSWIDICRHFVSGGDTLLAALEDTMSWQRGRRLMYGTWYDEPRLTATAFSEGSERPAVIDDARSALTAHYQRRFDGLFCNRYVDGQDSVAWHADRIGRTEIDPLVAIISIGGSRTFAMRPMGGGESHRFVLHSGDLLVMGGATQHHWEHAVPKVRSAAPRISVTMRAGGPMLDSLPVGTTVSPRRVPAPLG